MDLRHLVDYRLPLARRGLKQLLVHPQQLLKVVAQRGLVHRSLTQNVFHAGSARQIQLTDGLKHLLRSRPIYGYRFEGRRYDAGDKLGFLKATVEFALKRHDLGGPFREYLKSLNIS